MASSSQYFYTRDYDFIPDFSSILDYDFDSSIKLPLNYKKEIYHSQKNISLLLSEPILSNEYYNKLINNFDIDKQIIIDYLLLETLKKHSLLITYQKSGIASAIFVKYREQEYILTAGHTFSSYSENDLCIRIGNIDYSLNKCKGIIWPPSTIDSFLVLDYCVLYVEKELSKLLEEHNYEPYDIGNDIPEYDQNGIYNFYYGFPCTYNKFDIHTKNKNSCNSLCLDLPFEEKLLEFKNLKEINAVYKDIDYLDTNFSICDHKELLYSTKNIIDKKNAFKLPDLHGMSGCGVWRFIDYPFSLDNYVLEGMYLGADDNKNYTKLYFDKLGAILKYWKLLEDDLKKNGKCINGLIRY